MFPVPLPQGPTPELVRGAWAPVTIQVTWELVSSGVAVRSHLLDDVREHVLRSQPADATPDDAEWSVAPLVAEYLQRRRDGVVRRVEIPQPVAPVPLVWRARLLESADPIAEAVFRFRYAEGMSEADALKQLRVDGSSFAAALAGLRAQVGAFIAEAGGPAAISAREADLCLQRLAAYAEPGGPGPMGLLTPAGLQHADRCPRVSRAVRLIRAGHLDPRALFPPREGLPAAEVEVLLVLLHPEGAAHRAAMERALGPDVGRAGPDAWLVRAEGLDRAREGLQAHCAEGAPPRHHVRGARLTGPGRWSRGVLLGPLPVLALDAARARPWGEVMGIGELPIARPPPPRATAWWATAGALGVAVAVTLAWIQRPVEAPPPAPIAATFAAVDGGWDVRFDAPDLASVDVVVVEGGALQVVHRDLRAAKGAWATGHGDYKMRVEGDGVALVASPAGVDQLETIVRDSASSARPLETLAATLRARAPEADVVIRPPLAASSL